MNLLPSLFQSNIVVLLSVDKVPHVSKVPHGYMHILQVITQQLQAINTQCFGGEGDRPEAKNVAIVITDGVPHPDDRYQPAILEAERLRMQGSKKHTRSQ